MSNPATYTEGPFTAITSKLNEYEGDAVVNVYLVEGGTENALIDSGIHSGYKDIQKVLADKGIDEIKHVLNSHEHMDHVGNNAAVVRDYGATIGAHPKYKEWISNNELNAQMLVHRFEEGKSWDLQQEYLSWMGPESAKVDFDIEDGDKVEIGNVRLDIVGLPGHSLGEVGFHHAESNILIVLDLLLLPNDVVLYLHEDPDITLASHAKLTKFIQDNGVKTVLSAHGKPCTAEEAIAWSNECADRVRKIAASVRRHIAEAPGIEFAELRDRVCEDFGKSKEWRALITVNGHLESLLRKGVIVASGTGWSLA
ncbi:hypothetical protein GCM10012320_33030 [Sinomonas cellulolyticus]|uniref:MBL fold metallo-hydrolase n=1 Tax=Sinomonas cellulolyticus TaxID=2801916 RepID=A0ABS1JXB5_9MICC|nr:MULTISPECIES: MBL fold metallo-hydrolase [Sinomonas]MBL0703996.1 MBL fold metallo-hydrolase [Sinomonas cellulolyticus]GHG59095.1 hypothetical protein GCM10012320_33030 [Sinomonas sp. KCTC 49339]